MRGSIVVLVLALTSSSHMCNLKTPGVIGASGSHGTALAVSQPTKNYAGDHTVSQRSASTTTKVDFGTQVKPMLASRCQGCHFTGGSMYQRLPFDRPETIKTLGEKLFTRLKDENDRRLIRDFLTQ